MNVRDSADRNTERRLEKEGEEGRTVIAGHLLCIDVVERVDAGQTDQINGALLRIRAGRPLLAVLRGIVDVS